MALTGQAGMQSRQFVHRSARIKALSPLISIAFSGQTGTHFWQPVQASWSTTGFPAAEAARRGVPSPGTPNCLVIGEPHPGQAI